MRNLVAITAFFLTGILSAQTFSCGTVYTPPSGSSGRAVPSPPPIDPNKKYVISVYFHLLNDTDGTNILGASWGLPQVMNAVKALNFTFNQYNIFFKYLGHDVTNNSSL
ncbi:hypothetical protein [Flavobacterium sp.]|uniref:hypothetical protein n=1 Tax=Flavobacterium sp. TaxID=239 RepID=UPI0039E53290